MNNLKTLDKILILCAIALALFTIAMIVIFCVYQSVPDTLIISFFAVFSGEAGCCTYIWKSKLKNKFDNSISSLQSDED